MSKKNKIIRISLIVFFSLLLIAGLIIFIIHKKNDNNKPTVIPSDEPKIPEIKEDFNTASFKLIKKYNEYINYDNINNEIYFHDNDNYKYIVGSFGKIYDSPILDNTENNYTYNKYGNYKIEYDENEDKYLFINTKNETISDLYLFITPICHKEDDKDCEYFILQTDEYSYFIYDLYTEEITAELTNMSKIDGDLIKNKDYIPACKYTDDKHKNEACGLIDYKGNIIIDYIYDYIKEITSNTYIVYKNQKIGLINSKNEILVQVDNDNYNDSDNYIMFTKNKTLSVFTKTGKKIVDYTIPIEPNGNCDTYEDEAGYSFEETNNQLYITTFPECSFEDTLSTYNESQANKYLKTYLISNKKLEKIVNNRLHPLFEYDNKTNKYNLKYFYTENIKDKKITFTIYDLDLYEYYKFTPKYNDSISNYYIDSTETNKNYYRIQINNSSDKPTYFYIDLLNSREITEKDALYKYLDNGYGFIDDYKSIRVYKNDELIKEFEDSYTYVGGYYFIKSKSIYELSFEK